MSDNPAFRFTVAKLIVALKAFPPESPVLVSGYETGYENIAPLRMAGVKLKAGSPQWEGEFQEPDKGEEAVIEAVLLERVVRNE